MTEQTAPADPVAELLALEVPDEYRELVTVARTYAELAIAERKAGIRRGPAMERHIEESLGNPEIALDILAMLDNFVSSLPAHQANVKTIQLVNERVPRMAKFIETVKAHINRRPEVITALEQRQVADADYWRWQGHAEAIGNLARDLGLTVPHKPGETTEPVTPKEATTNA